MSHDKVEIEEAKLQYLVDMVYGDAEDTKRRIGLVVCLIVRHRD